MSSPVPMSAAVNTNVYETMNTHTLMSNSDEIPLNPSTFFITVDSFRSFIDGVTLVDTINGQTVPTSAVLIDPSLNMANSNLPTGPTALSSSTMIDQKIVPAAIGSERKRHIPMPTGTFLGQTTRKTDG
jgi:hypothetical protein